MFFSSDHQTLSNGGSVHDEDVVKTQNSLKNNMGESIMKKTVIASIAVAVAFGFSSNAFAAYPANFWELGMNPTETSNYAWVSGGVIGGAVVQNCSNCDDSFVDGDVQGSYNILASAENNLDDAQAYSRGTIENWSGISPDDDGEGGTLEAIVGGTAGAWEDGNNAWGQASSFGGVFTTGDAHGRVNGASSAFADFWKDGFQSIASQNSFYMPSTP